MSQAEATAWWTEVEELRERIERRRTLQADVPTAEPRPQVSPPAEPRTRRSRPSPRPPARARSSADADWEVEPRPVAFAATRRARRPSRAPGARCGYAARRSRRSSRHDCGPWTDLASPGTPRAEAPRAASFAAVRHRATGPPAPQAGRAHRLQPGPPRRLGVRPRAAHAARRRDQRPRAVDAARAPARQEPRRGRIGGCSASPRSTRVACPGEADDRQISGDAARCQRSDGAGRAYRLMLGLG